eukprot:GHVR01049220.1.p1 GENE.GHVR01049220.1~~GHVR01049220.1.p1  ORF type:complete len:101 (-),score=18.84 GHVR01049220.1:247-549(-)
MMEPFDGEPEYDSHPDVPPVQTTLIAVVTRSGRETEQKESLATPKPIIVTELPSGQATQLVWDIPTDTDSEEDEVQESVPESQDSTEEQTIVPALPLSAT